jgi:hypothetical protein
LPTWLHQRSRVELLNKILQEVMVFIQAGEVPTAAKHQCLIDRPLETVMPLFDIAVFIAVPDLSSFAFQTVMPEQSHIAVRELIQIVHIVHCRRQAVRAMRNRYPAQLPESILQTLAQTLEALRVADGGVLPVRVRQHKMVNHMGKTSGRQP